MRARERAYERKKSAPVLPDAPLNLMTSTYNRSSGARSGTAWSTAPPARASSAYLDRADIELLAFHGFDLLLLVSSQDAHRLILQFGPQLRHLIGIGLETKVLLLRLAVVGNLLQLRLLIIGDSQLLGQIILPKGVCSSVGKEPALDAVLQRDLIKALLLLRHEDIRNFLFVLSRQLFKLLSH